VSVKKVSKAGNKSQISATDSLKERYVMLPNEMTESAAWTSLADSAVWLYIEMRKSFKYKYGGNSGLRLPYQNVAWRMAKDTYTKHMRQIMRYGFLRIVEHGGLPNRPNIYALSESWRRISREVVDKSGREAIKLGLAKKPGTKDVRINLNHRKKKRR